LVDKAAEIKKSGINDISGFLQWWDETGQEESVQINEETDAIRVLTIHKAKGLEFKVVLIPFLDWRTVEGAGNVLWCVPGISPFDRAPLVPVRFSEKLNSTIFASDYFRELTDLLIDNLNMIYVAFTRAISVLWINVPADSRQDRIGSFLNLALQELSVIPDFKDSWDENEMKFTFGSIPLIGKSIQRSENTSKVKWEFNDFSGKLHIRRESDNFLIMNETGTTRRNTGKKLHSILAEIKTQADVESALKRAEAAGIIIIDEKNTLFRKIEQMITHQVANDWFTDKWQIFTETDLLTDEFTLRPDRMMIAGEQAVVVDYKSGDTRPESHFRQVERYKQVLRETGIKQIKGYLWYIQQNELVEV